MKKFFRYIKIVYNKNNYRHILCNPVFHILLPAYIIYIMDLNSKQKSNFGTLGLSIYTSLAKSLDCCWASPEREHYGSQTDFI